jgi:hypothetical protein
MTTNNTSQHTKHEAFNQFIAAISPTIPVAKDSQASEAKKHIDDLTHALM